MKMKIWLSAFLLLSIVATRAEDLSLNPAAPSSMADRVAQMVAAGDYARISKVTAEIDRQAKGVYDVAYFRNLLGVLAGLTRNTGNEPSYAHRWAIRKVLWKVLLTRHSNRADANSVLKMKDSLLWVVLSQEGVSRFADDDQFVALRTDAANLLWSYRASLGQWIVPNYKFKPMIGPTSVAVSAPNPADPAAAAPADAAAKLQQATFTRNKDENMEQIRLNDSLRLLSDDASSLITREFSWPTVDDATVTKLLDTFPPRTERRDQLLANLAGMRKTHLAEYGKLKEQAAAAIQQAK
jgi:hypothetical protein